MSLAIKPKRVSPAGTIPAGADLGESEIAVNWADGSIHTKRGGTVVSFYFVSGRTSDAISEGSVNLYFTTARAAAAAPVQQVAGRTGSITLTSSDIGGLGPLATLTTSGTASSSTYLRGDGQWTAVSSGTTYTAGSGITIASGTISAAVTQVAGRTGSITLTASDVSGLSTVATTGSAADLTGTISASRLPTSGVTAGTYTSVTVDTYGRVTAGSTASGGSSGGKSLGLILALT